MKIDKTLGTGLVDASPAFQIVLNTPMTGEVLHCVVHAGVYRLDTALTSGTGTIIWEMRPGVSFTGTGVIPFVVPNLNKGFDRATGYNSTVVGGAVEKVISKLCPGDSISMFSTENYGGSTIFPSDAVLLHVKATNSNEAPRAWSQNTNIVKISSATDNYSCGLEVSVQNQTSEVGLPNAQQGSLQGIFVSYIDTGAGNNYASAAYVVGGTGASASSGFKHGLWIDNITTNGNGITIKNSGSNAMDCAFDTRGYTGGFNTAAIALNNGHKITAKGTSGTSKNMMNMDAGGYFQVGDSSVPMVLNTAGFLIQGIPTQTTAGAIAGYIVLAINGVNRKIPFYAM